MSPFASWCLLWWPAGQPVLSHDFWCIRAYISDGFGFLSFTLVGGRRLTGVSEQGDFNRWKLIVSWGERELVSFQPTVSGSRSACQQRTSIHPPTTVPHLPPCPHPEPKGQLWFSSVSQSTRLFATPWTAACQASLSITSSWSLLKLMSIKSVVTSTISSSVVPFSSCLQSFPALGSFPRSQFFPSGCQRIGVSASASVLPMNIQGWFPLGWTGLNSLLFKGLSQESCLTPQFKSISSSFWSNCHIHTWLLKKSKFRLYEHLLPK